METYIIFILYYTRNNTIKENEPYVRNVYTSCNVRLGPIAKS